MPYFLFSFAPKCNKNRNLCSYNTLLIKKNINFKNLIKVEKCLILKFFFFTFSPKRNKKIRIYAVIIN